MPSRGSYAKGGAKIVGFYNLCEASMRCVLQTAKVKPMIHYIMVSRPHPHPPQPAPRRAANA